MVSQYVRDGTFIFGDKNTKKSVILMQKANFYSNGHADLADHTDDFNENEKRVLRSA